MFAHHNAVLPILCAYLGDLKGNHKIIVRGDERKAGERAIATTYSHDLMVSSSPINEKYQSPLAIVPLNGWYL